MKFETYIAKQVAKHGPKGFRSLLASDGFDSNGCHKVFSRVNVIDNHPTHVVVHDKYGETVKVQTAGPGRPAGSGDHDGLVRVRVPMREKSAWVKAAHKRGLKLSAWIRNTLNKEIC